MEFSFKKKVKECRKFKKIKSFVEILKKLKSKRRLELKNKYKGIWKFKKFKVIESSIFKRKRKDSGLFF